MGFWGVVGAIIVAVLILCFSTAFEFFAVKRLYYHKNERE